VDFLATQTDLSAKVQCIVAFIKPIDPLSGRAGRFLDSLDAMAISLSL